MSQEGQEKEDEDTKKYAEAHILIELYNNECPLICKNFIALCEGDHKNSAGCQLTYLNTKMTKIVSGAFIFGG